MYTADEDDQFNVVAGALDEELRAVLNFLDYCKGLQRAYPLEGIAVIDMIAMGLKGGIHHDVMLLQKEGAL
jgi:hypothetical protein